VQSSEFFLVVYRCRIRVFKVYKKQTANSTQSYKTFAPLCLCPFEPIKKTAANGKNPKTAASQQNKNTY